MTFEQSLAASSGKIVKIGAFEDLRSNYPRADLVDLNNRTVIPPFYDGHVHFEFGGFLHNLPSLEGKNERDALDIIAAAVENTRRRGDDEWIILGMYEKSAGFLNKTLLDKIVDNRPVLILSRDLHAAVMNSNGLNKFDLDDFDRRGLLGKDASGHADGLILENAVEECFNITHQPHIGQIKESLLVAQNLALQYGIAGISDNVNCDIAQAYIELENEGRLKIKVDAWMNSNDFNLAALDFDHYEGKNFRLKTIKGFLDGSFASKTAYMRENYAGRKQRGIKRISERDLTVFVKEAEKQDLGIALHAIGDAAVDMALSAMRKANADPGRKHRLEHIQVLYDEHLRLMKEMGITASVQPVHLAYDWRTAENIMGPDRCKSIYPFNSIARSGVDLAFGTDWPVAGLNPAHGIHCTVNRKDLLGLPETGWYPTENLDVLTALQAYSAGSKHSAGWLINAHAAVYIGDTSFLTVESEFFEKESRKALTVNSDFIIL